MFFSTLNITKNICDDDDDGAVDVDDMVWHSVCVWVPEEVVEADLCVNVEISHSPLFSLLLESLLLFCFYYIFVCASLLPMLLWPVHLSLGLLALLKYQISTWLTREPVQKNLMEEKLFHIFSIFLSCCLFEGLEKQSESSSWLLLTLEQNSECACVFVLKQHIC